MMIKSSVLKQRKSYVSCMDKVERPVDAARAMLLRKMVGDGEKLTSKSKVRLSCLPPCYLALKPNFQ